MDIMDLIYKKFGKEPLKASKPTMGLWANNPPKEIFKVYVEFTNSIFPEPILVIIDDLTPKFLNNRDDYTQEKITRQYLHFFEDYDCNCTLLSETHPQLNFFEISAKISTRKFIHYLPAFNADSKNFNLFDIFHLVNNIQTYHLCFEKGDILVLGENVQRTFLSFLDISKKFPPNKPIKALILKKINQDEINTLLNYLRH